MEVSMRKKITTEQLRQDTIKHIEDVRSLSEIFADELLSQVDNHDQDKLSPDNLDILKNALNGETSFKEWTKIHNENCRHHVNFHDNVNVIPFIDLVKMVIDGACACYRIRVDYLPTLYDQVSLYINNGFTEDIAYLLAHEFMRQYKKLQDLEKE